MKKFKLVLVSLLCLVLFCGCMVDHGEGRFAKAYDEIITGQKGTSLTELQDRLGEGTWVKSFDATPAFVWQNGDMMITVTFDENARAVTKQKNW